MSSRWTQATSSPSVSPAAATRAEASAAENVEDDIEDGYDNLQVRLSVWGREGKRQEDVRWW